MTGGTKSTETYGSHQELTPVIKKIHTLPLPHYGDRRDPSPVPSVIRSTVRALSGCCFLRDRVLQLSRFQSL